MVRYFFLTVCLFISCHRWSGIDATARCFKCKGHSCQWKNTWQNCTGDACFIRNPSKYKMSDDKNAKVVFKPTTHHKTETPFKPKTTTHKSIIHSAVFHPYKKTDPSFSFSSSPFFPYHKTPSTHFHFAPKSTTTAQKFKAVVTSAMKSSAWNAQQQHHQYLQPTTKYSHQPHQYGATSKRPKRRVAERDWDRDAEADTDKDADSDWYGDVDRQIVWDGDRSTDRDWDKEWDGDRVKGKVKRSSSSSSNHQSAVAADTERGCLQEEEIPRLGCHKNLCVCLKDFCNDQVKVEYSRSLVLCTVLAVAAYNAMLGQV